MGKYSNEFSYLSMYEDTDMVNKNILSEYENAIDDIDMEIELQKEKQVELANNISSLQKELDSLLLSYNEFKSQLKNEYD